MEIALFIAFVALIGSIVGAAIEIFSIRHIDKRLAFEHEFMEKRGTIGEQFGEFLMAKKDEVSPSNLQIMATEVGQTLYASLREGAGAVLSGEKRHQNMVENRTLEALEASDPEMKVLKSIFDRLGLDELWNPKDIPSVVNVLRKHGVLGPGSNPASETRAGW